MVSIDLDITLFIQMLNFVIALVVVNCLIVKPIREVLRQRRASLEQLKSDGDGYLDRAEKRLGDYEAELAGAREKADTQKELIRKEGLDKESAIAGAAQAEAQSILQNSRKELEGEAAQALAALRAQAPEMARRVVARVLN
ncbi:ATP synthase F0 subunit B [Desulfovibrio sp. OttesenSCG-928-C14]|nr:ATP synthase F0 subunit B [Desulfovibrio sp. OttesenSCG-928-C14]